MAAGASVMGRTPLVSTQSPARSFVSHTTAAAAADAAAAATPRPPPTTCRRAALTRSRHALPSCARLSLRRGSHCKPVQAEPEEQGTNVADILAALEAEVDEEMRSTTAADGGDQAGGREYVEGMAIADDEYVTGGEAVDAPLPQPLWGTDPPNHRCGYVAIVGRPNAGKSTLMNGVVGAKLSIVTYKPQTTRHRILGLLSDEDSQMILLDTPGVVDEKRNKMEELMMDSVGTSLKDADLVIAMVDAAGRTPKQALDGLLPAFVEKRGVPLVVVLNKCDLLTINQVTDLQEFYTAKYRGLAEVMAVSAREGQGVPELVSWAKQRLPYGPSLYPRDVLSEHPERFFIAEIVREQLFLQYRQEVPYACSVVCTGYVERPPPQKDLVEVEIMVTRDAHKGILIGRGGTSMKALTSAARAEVEKFVDREVFLKVEVKVRGKWMEDEEMLGRSGLMRTMTASSDLSGVSDLVERTSQLEGDWEEEPVV